MIEVVVMIGSLGSVHVHVLVMVLLLMLMKHG